MGGSETGLWDEDDDARLTEAEWNEDAATWFGTADYGTWGDWDTNTDEYLTAEEFTAGLNQSGLMRGWDADRTGAIEGGEFGEGLFGVFDTNDDTYLDTNEWGAGTTEWGLM